MDNKPKIGKKGDEDKVRIAIINVDRCKPKKCKQECKKN